MSSHKTDGFLSAIFSLFIFLFFRISSWMCSLPAWITLILHFTVGLPIWWFWATLAVWIVVGILRWSLIYFGIWGARASANEPPKENKNPYSYKSDK